jgi:REP element-mobilizing transposase RayT
MPGGRCSKTLVIMPRLNASLRRPVRGLSMRLLAYCVMPNHWHLEMWPHQDGALWHFMNWLTLTHTQRWHQHRHTADEGPVYFDKLLLPDPVTACCGDQRMGDGDWPAWTNVH